jgi:hypothetical protein
LLSNFNLRRFTKVPGSSAARFSMDDMSAKLAEAVADEAAAEAAA